MEDVESLGWPSSDPSAARERGRMEDGPWALVLAALAQRARTGQVTVRSATGKVHAVAFSNGRVVGATSPMAVDSVARVAASLHLPVAAAAATAGARAHRRTAGPDSELEAYVVAARLSPAQTLELKRRLLVQRAARTFAIEHGTYAIESRCTIPVVLGCEVDVRAVVFAGALLHVDGGRMAAELAGVGSRFAFADHAAGELARFEFGDAEKPILAALREGTSVPEIEARHREIDPRRAQAVFYALATCGALVKLPARPARVLARGSVELEKVESPQGPAWVRLPTGADALEVAVATLFEPAEAVTSPAAMALAPARAPASAPASAPAPGPDDEAAAAPGALAADAPPGAATDVPVAAPVVAPVVAPVAALAPAEDSAPHATAAVPTWIHSDVEVTVRGGAHVVALSAHGDVALSAHGDVALSAHGDVAPSAHGDVAPSAHGDAARARAVPPPPPRPGRGGQRADQRAFTEPFLDARPTTLRPNALSAAELKALIAERSAAATRGADHFELLGVPVGASVEAVRAAYVELARNLRTERLVELRIHDQEFRARGLFAQLCIAYTVLTDPDRRATYLAGLQRASVARAEPIDFEQIAREAYERGARALRADDAELAVVELRSACELAPNDIRYLATLGHAEFCAAAAAARRRS